MKKYTTFDLDKKVTDYEGTIMKLQVTQETFIDLTVRNAFRKALGSIYHDEERTITLDAKLFRSDISEKIWNAALSVELKTEEQAELKKCVGKLFSGEALAFLIKIIEASADTIANNNGAVDSGKKKQLIADK
jgi:hypothetical protein